MQTGQPLSDLENASPAVIRALNAILHERNKAQQKANQRR